MFKTEHKLTKTELKENGLLKLIERWQQLCIDGHSYEYDKNIDRAICYYKIVETFFAGSYNPDFPLFYMPYKNNLTVLCIISGISKYYEEEYFEINSYIKETATVRQYENYEVLRHGISILQKMEEKNNIIKQYNNLAAKLKLEDIPLYGDGVDYSIAIDAMEDLFNLLQKARKDAAGEKLRELSPHLNLTFTGPIHNSGTLTGSVINPQYNK